MLPSERLDTSKNSNYVNAIATDQEWIARTAVPVARRPTPDSVIWTVSCNEVAVHDENVRYVVLSVIEPCGANVAGRGNGSRAGQPAGMPGSGPTNRPYHEVVVCSVLAVQLLACSVAVDEPPGATLGGAKASDVMRTVAEHRADTAEAVGAAPAALAPPPAISAAVTASKANPWFHLRMASPLSWTMRVIY